MKQKHCKRRQRGRAGAIIKVVIEAVAEMGETNYDASYLRL